MKFVDLFKKKPKEEAVAKKEDEKNKSAEEIIDLGMSDDGIPEVDDKDDGSVILEDEPEEEEPGKEGEETESEPGAINLGTGEKPRYEFTKEEIGDILGDRKIRTTTEDIAAYIQVLDFDPVTRRRTWHKVQWFGEDYGTFPINLEDMVNALDPGKYCVRIVDAKKLRTCFANISVTVGMPEDFPLDDGTGNNRSPGEPPSLAARLKNVEDLVVQMGQFTQSMAANLVPKNDPQQMMNTMTMGLMQKTLEGGNGSDKVIEKIADMMTKTQEMMMGFRTKVEEKKIDFDFEKIRSQNEMELKKMELTLAKGMPADDEGKKSKNTLQSFIEGLQSFMQTAGPALKEIRKLRELEMGVVPTGDDTGEQETTPE